MTSYMSASEAGLDTCTAAPYAESMTTVHIGIPNDQAAALRAKAAAQGLSLEEWFRALAEQSGSAAVQPEESRREMRPIWEVISDNMKKVPPEDLAALRKDGASQIDHCNGTTVNIRAGNWCCGQSGTDAQFHDSIEVAVERDYPFRALRPKRLNEFGIPEKRKFREELAQLLREYGAVLTGLIILQLVVYSYFFTGLIFTNHTFPNSWVLSYPSYRTRGEGRWLADLIVSLQGGSGVQPFQMAVAVVIQAVNGIAFARLVGLERRLEVALSAAFICLYPAFLDNYSFGMDHVTFGVADAFALAGALCLKRLLPSLKSALIVAFLFVLGIASYQPKIAFVGLLCICYLVMRIAGDGIVYPFALKEAAKEIGYVSSILFGAILVYFVSMKLSVTDDAGVRAHLNSVSDMIRQVPESYKQFFRYFTRDADYLPDWIQLLPVLTILLGCVLLLVGAHRRHIVALALTVMLVLLIPVVLRASYLINSNTWENAGRITFVNGYAFLFFLSQGFQVAGLRKFVAGLFGIFLYFFVIVGTQEANSAALKTVYDLNMINRIAARIETNVSDLYVKQHALVVVGRYPPFPRPKYARYGNGYENFNKRIHVQTDAFEPYRQTEILNFFLGREVLRRPTPLQREKALASIGRRQPWPSSDAVYAMDDVILVLLEPFDANVARTWTTEQ